MKKRDVMLTTAAHRPAFDDFADAMKVAESNEGWRSSEALRHFLEAGYRALRGRYLFGEAREKNEAEYMKIVARCRKPTETMTAISKMLGATCLALAADPVDFIGPVFSELSADSGMGQFFTPHALSYLNAKMILDDAPAMLADKPYITLQEPACGVGGMVLAANLVLREQGIDVARQAHWVMVDVDFRAMCGAYIQATCTETSAEVIHGNTLSLESWAVSLTPAAILYPKSFKSDAGKEPDDPRGDDPALPNQQTPTPRLGQPAKPPDNGDRLAASEPKQLRLF
jgi:hypothetical protein